MGVRSAISPAFVVLSRAAMAEHDTDDRQTTVFDCWTFTLLGQAIAFDELSREFAAEYDLPRAGGRRTRGCRNTAWTSEACC